MSVLTRPAQPSDLPTMVDLLVEDAAQRSRADPLLWTLAADAPARVAGTLRTAMEAASPHFRQRWILAETDGKVVGLAHDILLPVPPIYAGAFGPPGLIMEDCFVAPGAPAGTAAALLEAVERDLTEAGAEILVASSVAGGAWAPEYAARGYEPLTLYLARRDPRAARQTAGVRKAGAADIPAIVAASAANRRTLAALDAFWKPHPDADARFGAWMRRSLTLTDRDMFVSEAEGDVEGYVISQPATSLHFPAAHDIAGVGIIDDFFHEDFADPARLEDRGHQASELLVAAEAALAARGNGAALVVCPAAWRSKIALLQGAGYDTAIVWSIKRPAPVRR